jgi:hypothetical protein
MTRGKHLKSADRNALIRGLTISLCVFAYYGITEWINKVLVCHPGWKLRKYYVLLPRIKIYTVTSVH